VYLLNEIIHVQSIVISSFELFSFICFTYLFVLLIRLYQLNEIMHVRSIGIGSFK